MKKLLAVVVAIAVMGGVLDFLFTGPRMIVQPHVKPHQARMPTTPAGAVPVASPFERLPSAEAAASLANPLEPTKANLLRGKVYYEYYCLACHGPAGDGHGPVGESYVPAPTDLRSPKVRAYTDGQLLRAMLLGTGHAPMLERIVWPRHRWPLVLYTRHLAAQSPASRPAAP